jgi:hypothetical protein
MNWVKEQFLDRVYTFGSVYAMFAGKRHYRYIRGLISKESLKGKILIPAYGDQFYTDVELLPIEDVERYAQSQINHIKNQYRNKVRPLKKYIKDEKLKKMMGTLDMMEETE